MLSGKNGEDGKKLFGVLKKMLGGLEKAATTLGDSAVNLKQSGAKADGGGVTSAEMLASVCSDHLIIVLAADFPPVSKTDDVIAVALANAPHIWQADNVLTVVSADFPAIQHNFPAFNDAADLLHGSSQRA
jgi:hypothetical protein